MKVALTLLLTLTLGACTGERPPTAPVLAAPIPVVPIPVVPNPGAPGQVSTTFVWGLIVGESGVCLDDATVRVVKGQRLGQSIKQDSRCDAWAYWGGFTFDSLTPGVAMTLRVSAPGFEDEEREVVPFIGEHTAEVFALLRK